MKTVIEMAREAAAMHGHILKDVLEQATLEFIEAFAELVRADERDAVLKLADSLGWVSIDDIIARTTNELPQLQR